MRPIACPFASDVMPETIVLPTRRATIRLGQAIARALAPSDLVTLDGPLGAGKTFLVRAMLRALGVPEDVAVTSPTFTLGHRYDEASPPASHLDLHRLGGLADEDPALLMDYVGPEFVAFVEWPEVAAGELEGLGRIAVTVALEHAGRDERRIAVT